MPPKRKNNNKSTETADDSDEELFSLTMVKQLMAQQESAFKTVIESLIKSTTERVDGLVKQVVELKASLEYSQRDIEENQKSAKQNEQTIAAITAQLNDTKNLMNKCQEKNTYLENQSRRNNIRVYGVEEKPRETWEETEAALKSILIEKLQLPSEPRIERARRTGKPTKPDGSPRQGPRPIICRLYDWKEKESILKQARRMKPSGLYIHEDVAEATLEKRRSLMPRLKQAKDEGKVAYFVLDKLVIKNRQHSSTYS